MVNKSILNIVSGLNTIKTIGLFYPYKNEVDVILMASELENIGLTCLLPRVIDEHSPLKYFFYSPNNSNLEKGYGGIMEPTGNESIDPDIIIASCSAFNEKGYRVGYGGGFFDRTLSLLKQKKNWEQCNYKQMSQTLIDVLMLRNIFVMNLVFQFPLY